MPNGASGFPVAHRRPYAFLEAWLAARVAGRRVADLGCGDGWVLETCVNGGAGLVIGVDRDSGDLPRMKENCLAQAREKTLAFRQVSLCQADVQALPLCDGTIDLIICAGVFPYLDHALAAAEIRRVLRPGGSMLLIDVLADAPWWRYYRRWRYPDGNWRANLLYWDELEQIFPGSTLTPIDLWPGFPVADWFLQGSLRRYAYKVIVEWTPHGAAISTAAMVGREIAPAAEL